jgi:hypothetical protein
MIPKRTKISDTPLRRNFVRFASPRAASDCSLRGMLPRAFGDTARAKIPHPIATCDQTIC